MPLPEHSEFAEAIVETALAAGYTCRATLSLDTCALLMLEFFTLWDGTANIWMPDRSARMLEIFAERDPAAFQALLQARFGEQKPRLPTFESEQVRREAVRAGVALLMERHGEQDLSIGEEYYLRKVDAIGRLRPLQPRRRRIYVDVMRQGMTYSILAPSRAPISDIVDHLCERFPDVAPAALYRDGVPMPEEALASSIPRGCNVQLVSW